MQVVWSPEFRELAQFTAAEVMKRNDGRTDTVSSDNGIATEWGIDDETRVFAAFLNEGGAYFPVTDSDGTRHRIIKMGHLNIRTTPVMEHNTLAYDGSVWRRTITDKDTKYWCLTEPMMLELIIRATEI